MLQERTNGCLVVPPTWPNQEDSGKEREAGKGGGVHGERMADSGRKGWREGDDDEREWKGKEKALQVLGPPCSGYHIHTLCFSPDGIRRQWYWFCSVGEWLQTAASKPTMYWLWHPVLCPRFFSTLSAQHTHKLFQLHESADRRNISFITLLINFLKPNVQVDA